jgi:OMF family outer membrane factor
MKHFSLLILLVFILCYSQGRGQTPVNSLQELYQLADSTAFSLKIQKQELTVAKLTKQASYGNIFNPRLPINASIIDNTELPVNFIPAEVFGGAPGTFREVVFGQQYISTLTATPQLDLIAPGRWGEVRMAEVNYEKVQVNGIITQRYIRNSLCSYYYTILHLDAQRQLLEKNYSIADSIYHSVQAKAIEGLVRQSDVNEAQIFLLQQSNLLNNNQKQYESTLLQLENVIGRKVQVTGSIESTEIPSISKDSRELDLKRLEMLYAKSAWRASKFEQLPVLSFVSSFAYQNNSNDRFFDSNQRWINSNYIGLRLTWDFPTNVQKLTNVRNQKLKFNMASTQYEQALLSVKNKELEQQLEWSRLEKELQSISEIRLLEQANFGFALDQYNQGLIPLERLLQVQLNKIQAEVNEHAAKASLSLQTAIINNGL